MLPRLYAIVDPLTTGHDPVALGEAMLAGGARCLQLRLKDAAPREVLTIAQALRTATTAAGALLIINDRPDIARAACADGVHLGQDDLPIAAARRVLASGQRVGLSTHDLAQAVAGHAAGADYLGVGPMFTTQSKRDALPARGVELVRAVRTAVPLPLVAIGGITLDTAPAILAAGADSIAMIAALVTAQDVTAAVQTAVARLG